MNNLELPLVFFTVLSQTAIGLVAISTLRQWAVEGPTGNIRQEWITASAFIIAGMLASFFHLGHPLQGYTALKHLGRAWLSREVLAVSIFLVLTILGLLMAGGRINKLVAFGAALVGLATIFFMGMTYSPPGYPAINNVLPLVFFLLTALLLGTSFASWFASSEKRIWLTRVLTASLIVGLVVYLIVPCIWLSGGTVMAQTGWAWIGSPLYWARILIGLLLPLAVVWTSRDIPVWLPVIILLGEIMGRMVFFKDTVHAAGNLGGLY
ncbi:MAG: DmsC/YnfH family molybdoenzyme membrane anchor subunit [Desulfobacterales bacterium]